jgi:HSP20 family molecular chaperone IbpA
MFNSTLNTLTSLTPLDINGFFLNSTPSKDSISSINKHNYNISRQGITFIDKPDRYLAVLNVAGFDKSEINITEEKSTSGYSTIKVSCQNKELTTISYLFCLPSNANLNTIKSVLKNGLLTFSCEVKNQKPKSISIEIE